MPVTLNKYRVVRCTSKLASVKMRQGDSTWNEKAIWHRVVDSEGNTVGTVTNSTVLCLPGNSVRATEATDEQIIAAVVGDESVF